MAGDPSAPPLAIMDTNVFLDIHSCHDVKNDFDRLHAALGPSAVDDPAMTYRIARARESLLVAMYLHKVRGTTMSLRHEAIEMLHRRAPPAPGGTDMKSDFTMSFAWFTKDYCLRAWNPVVTEEHGGAERSEADRAYVALAKGRTLPLITNEGYCQDGSIDETRLIRREARQANVRVFTPKQFYEQSGDFDEEAEIDAFLARFRGRVPSYLTRRNKHDKMTRVLRWIHGFYRFVLRGEVEGRATPVRVRLG